MSDSLTIISNHTAADCDSDGECGAIYIIDGKVWRIGQQKISKWSNAKCNKVIKDNGNDNQSIDPQSTSIKDNSSH
jgi:hypothetical protein